MSFREVLRLALESLRANFFRTSLTLLGMIIGVLAVILLVSLGQGAKNYVLSEFESLGTNLVIIQPGRTDRKNAFGPPVGAAKRKMTLADVRALERRATSLDAVSGLVFASASIRFEDALSNVSVFGANEEFAHIISLPIGIGAFYTREEDDYGRRVVVLGSKVKSYIFGDEYPIGRTVKINNSEFRVIGVLAEIGDKLGFNLDEFAIIPTTAALRLFNEDKLFGIRARASSRVSLPDVIAEVEQILTERRNGEKDFTVITQDSAMQSLGRLLNMLSYVLGGIAAISMLVGGIGIMNIMLVSVTERTSEIGIRRAVGARRRDILKQFIVEAGVLGLLSGVIGILLALGITYGALLAFPSFDMRPPSWIIAPAFVLCVLVGVIFGAWPALRASRIEPLEALRHE